MTNEARGDGVRTTETVRRAIQQSGESVRTLARRFGVSPTTIQKWRKRTTTADAKMGPKTPASTVLTLDEERTIIGFRRQTSLPLDDCLYALQPVIPNLTRSSLHRCLQRHGLSQLAPPPGPAAQRGRGRDLTRTIGTFHISIPDAVSREGRLHLHVATDVTAKLGFGQLHSSADLASAAAFLEALIEAVPYDLRALLTDHPAMDDPRFSALCRARGIEHRTIEARAPWADSRPDLQGDPAVASGGDLPAFESHAELCEHIAKLLDIYNYKRRLKALRGLTPCQYIAQAWAADPSHFKPDSYQYFDKLNDSARRLILFRTAT